MAEKETLDFEKILDKIHYTKDDRRISQYSNAEYLPYIEGNKDTPGSLKLTRLDKCNDTQENEMVEKQFGCSSPRPTTTASAHGAR